MTFNSNRMRLARRRRSLTGAELAQKAGVTAVTVSRLEHTNNEPLHETVEAIAAALNYPTAFFYGHDLDEVDKDEASFRSLKAMTARERDAALAAASIAFHLSDWVDDRFRLPGADVPDLGRERDSILDPETAARRLRSLWGLGEQRIGNMIDLLEAKGVRVFSLAENTKRVDAFSCWRNGVPYVFLNTYKSAEHSRFDACHELAHLCLHKHGGPKQQSAETEANAFASSFLMPEADVRARVRGVTSLTQIMAAKKRWGVSLAAMVYRLGRLGITSEWQTRQFFIEMSRRGFRTDEPDPMPRETSHIWQTVFRELWKDRVTRDRLALDLGIPNDELESVVFGLSGTVERPGSARPTLAVDNR